MDERHQRPIAAEVNTLVRLVLEDALVSVEELLGEAERRLRRVQRLAVQRVCRRREVQL